MNGADRAWGIHLDVPGLDFVADDFISIGWDEIGDPRKLGDKEILKQKLASAYPSAKPGAIPVWAGVLLRFENEMKQGDLIVYPRKSDRTINLGIVNGDYDWRAEAPVHRNRRPVRWIKTELPRGMFSQGALYEIGSAITLFRVKKHVAEFVQASRLDQDEIDTEEPKVVEAASQDEASAVEDAPNAERILDSTRDYIVKTLATDFKGHAFAEFTARLLEAMGYRTQVSPP